MRIPALDGWRGIAILLVLAQHIQSAVLLGTNRGPWFVTGRHGVTAFFVLSGYLITGKLLEGGSLKRFYTRRFFRLMPVAWSYLAFTVLLGSLFPLFFPHDALSCLFFTRNYIGHSAITVHFWSLSIEEQFYLVWPALLLLTGKRAKWIALSGAVIPYLWWYTHQSFYSGMHYARTEVQCGALFLGCFLALNKDLKLRWLFWPSIAYLAWECLQPDPVPSLFEMAAWGIAICYSKPHWLSCRPLTWFGRISYSVYVWNLLAMAVIAANHNWATWAIFPLLPVASYYAIERPGVALGDWLLNRRVVVFQHS